MKLRKILAGFLAGAVAMSSMVFSSAAAESTTTTLYEFDDSQVGVISSLTVNYSDVGITADTTEIRISVTGTQVAGTEYAAFYAMETTSWKSVSGGGIGTDLVLNSTTAVNNEDGNVWNNYLAASAFNICPQNIKVDTITVSVDSGSPVTVYDVETDAVAGFAFPDAGENYLISAADLAAAGVTADNAAECSLTMTIGSVSGETRQVSLLGGAYNWSNQFYYTTDYAVGELTMSFSGISETAAAALETDGLTLFAKNLVMTKLTITAPPATVAVESITLDKTTAALTVGDTATLTATVLPANATDPTVTWSSDKASVATVANGVVTAVGEGTATITATAGEFSATCTVTVTAAEEEPTDVAVTSVTLDKTSLELEVDGTATLTATVLPANATDPTVTWSSDKASVATVANGVVTAVGEGTATITATAGGKTATCTVTVTAPVEDEEDTSDTVIWEGNTDLGTSWGSITVDKTAASAGDKIKVTYTSGSADTYQQLKFMDSSWNAFTSMDGLANEWDCIDVTAGTASTYELTLNAADAAALTSGGMLLSGYNVTITKIELIPSETSGFDKTAAEFEVADAGKVVTQTADFGDGAGAKRFTMLVSMDAIEDAGEVIFTLVSKSNTTGASETKTYKTDKYYTSLTASGATVNAPSGYGFVSLTVIGIPESVELTCTNIELNLGQ